VTLFSASKMEGSEEEVVVDSTDISSSESHTNVGGDIVDGSIEHSPKVEEKLEIEQESVHLSAEQLNKQPSDLESIVDGFPPDVRETYEDFVKQLTKEEQIPQDVLVRIFILSDKKLETAVRCGETFLRLWYKANQEGDLTKVIEEVQSNMVTIGNKDHKGRLIIHFHYHKHDPKLFAIETSVKMFFLLADIMLRDRVALEEGVICVCWMKNSGWRNFDLGYEKIFTELIISLSPMSYKLMHKVILVDSPWYVWIAMKLMSPFLTKEISDTLLMCSEQELRAQHGDYLQETSLFLDTLQSPDYHPWAPQHHYNTSK